MKALTLAKGGGLSVGRGRPEPPLKDGLALIRPVLAGICATDLEISKGYMGFEGVPGHEFVGVVVKAPWAPELEGKRVVGEINIPCGKCPSCLEGIGNHCPSRSVLGILGWDGVFADRFCLPIANLHLVPDSVGNEAAVFTEPLAAAYQILEQVEFNPGMKTALLGPGRLGQLIARAFSAEGAPLAVIGRNKAKLDLLDGLPGVSPVLEKDAGAMAPFDVVIEATGSPKGMARAMELVKPRGVIVLKTTVSRPAALDINTLVINEVSVIGSRCGPFPKAMEALEDGKVDPTPLVSRVTPLDEAKEAFSFAASRKAMKVLLSFS